MRFIFTRKEYLDASCQSLSFYDDRLAAVVPRNHLLSKKKQISVSELRNENLLLLSKSTLHYDKITEICRQKGFEPMVVYTGTHMDNILDLVSKKHGISLLMQHAVEYLHHSGVVIIPLKEDFSVPSPSPATIAASFLLPENYSGTLPKIKFPDKLRSSYLIMSK